MEEFVKRTQRGLIIMDRSLGSTESQLQHLNATDHAESKVDCITSN